MAIGYDVICQPTKAGTVKSLYLAGFDIYLQVKWVYLIEYIALIKALAKDAYEFDS